MEVRLSGPTLKVVRCMLLDPQSSLSGYEITKRCGIGSSTMYPLLARLERAGWIEGAWEDINPSQEGRPRRRNYKLTPTGRANAVSALSEYGLPWGATPSWI